MAENTRMKELAADITRLKDLPTEISRFAETMERREQELQQWMEHLTLREQDAENRFRTLESTLGSLLQAKPPFTEPTSFQVRNVKLDFPRFDGIEVLQWIFKAEQFFNYYRTPDDQRLIIASIHLEKEVIPWFQMQNRANAFPSWVAFTRALETKFGPSPYECPRATLFKLSQTSSVHDYYTQFTSLANHVQGITAEALLDCFVGGLKPDLKRDVIAQNPASLLRCISLAKLYEEKYIPRNRLHNSPYYPKTQATNTSPMTSQSIRSTSLPPLLSSPHASPSPSNTKPNFVKKFTAAEMQLRHEKGLCFTCDEKFTMSHRCPNKQYFVLQVDEDEILDVQHDPLEDPGETDTPSAVEHHLSYNALKGSSGLGTMKFKGSINGMMVQVLLNSGSSNNFLQPRIAHCLKLPVEPIPNFQVLVGNGNALVAEGLIKDLQVKIQGYMLQLPVYLLPISGADLVLRATWLATLGPHISDYSSLSIKFHVGDQFVTLCGDHSLLPQPANFNHLKRMCHTKAIVELYSLQIHSYPTRNDQLLDLPDNMEPELVLLLHQYKTFFDILNGLPPDRQQNHSIPLVEGASPVKVRPYRYPHRIIIPSTSPFSSPIIFVRKKDDTWRFCTDYRALNVITVKDSFPIPTVDELLDELYGAQFFSKLDLRLGYHQILIKEEDRHKTTFRTHQGHYEWLALMNDIFQGKLRKFVLVFFDDILVYSPTLGDHLQHLEIVLQILQHHQLYAKLSKCSFGLQEVDYLGHTVSGKGVAMNQEKIQAVMQWNIPTNLKQLRGFLGLTGYYRRFIKHYASIAGPLTNLKNDCFKWDEEATNAFDALKAVVTQALVLMLPDFTIPFVLETDVSGSAIGAVLIQNNHPIAYFSKKLNPRLQRQSAYVREFFAITEAVAKFRHYLLGHKFVIRTDQRSLKSLTEQAIQTPEQQKWIHKLLGYDFTIEYKAGKENVVADSLSRSFMMAWSQPQLHFIPELQSALKDDVELKKIIDDCVNNRHLIPHYAVHDGLLYWKDRLIIPASHDLAVMQQDVKQFVQNCLICQQAKSVNSLPLGLLQPLPVQNQIWEDVAMDFITHLPKSQGYTVIMVVIDRLSKYAHLCPLKADYKNKQVAEAFMKTVIKLHDFPKTIVSDRDKVFVSNFWQHLFKLSGTTLNMSTAYHPQSDGQSEALNKCLEMYLRCYTYASPKEWVKFLPWAEFWYNTAYHHSSGMTPFKVVYGREPPQLIQYSVTSYDPPLQPYRQHSVALRKNQKLGMKYFGPFPIVERIGSVAITKIHPVFHSSQLKPCKGDHTQQYIPTITIDSDTSPIIYPVVVLKVRHILQGNQTIKQFLIQWKGLEDSTPTWEDEVALHKAYPDFNLEDKKVRYEEVNFQPGWITDYEVRNLSYELC
ncbi:hypothetical protein V8G54_003069 [Vigna mungo]|uniref:Ty3/gypsy retrotransposon protein n=1 Tax=Vigna mungo TaxID=3915 RepID=A0AAQ3P9U7_VIGMU